MFMKTYLKNRKLNENKMPFEKYNIKNISRYENGDRKTNQDILFKLSQLFGVSINENLNESSILR